MSVAGATCAPKGELDLRARRAGIDIKNARRNIAHGPLHAIDVLRIDGAGKAVLCVVVDRDAFSKRLYLNHGKRRAKNLFLYNAHFMANIAEERGVIEIPTS